MLRKEKPAPQQEQQPCHNCKGTGRVNLENIPVTTGGRPCSCRTKPPQTLH